MNYYSLCGKKCDLIYKSMKNTTPISACCGVTVNVKFKKMLDDGDEIDKKPEITLRDQFAIAAMGALISFENRENLNKFVNTPEACNKFVVECSYRLADAMMKERGTR